MFHKDPVEVVTNTGKVIHRSIEGEDKIIEEMEKLIDFLASNDYETLVNFQSFITTLDIFIHSMMVMVA